MSIADLLVLAHFLALESSLPKNRHLCYRYGYILTSSQTLCRPWCLEDTVGGVWGNR